MKIILNGIIASCAATVFLQCFVNFLTDSKNTGDLLCLEITLEARLPKYSGIFGVFNGIRSWMGLKCFAGFCENLCTPDIG